MMLQLDEPSDFILATGESRSVRDLVETAFKTVGISLRWEGEGWSIFFRAGMMWR